MALSIESVITMMLKNFERQLELGKGLRTSNDSDQSVSEVSYKDQHHDRTEIEKAKVVSMLNGNIDEKLKHYLSNNLQSSPVLRKIADNLERGKELSLHEQNKLLDLLIKFEKK